MDRGAWRALVHSVTKSWTWLKQLNPHVHTENAVELSGISRWKSIFRISFPSERQHKIWSLSSIAKQGRSGIIKLWCPHQFHFSAHFVRGKKKYFWNTAKFLAFPAVYACVQTTWAELNCDRDHVIRIAWIVTIRSFTEEFTPWNRWETIIMEKMFKRVRVDIRGYERRGKTPVLYHRDINNRYNWEIQVSLTTRKWAILMKSFVKPKWCKAKKLASGYTR